MEFLDLVRRRYSVRDYQDTPVEESTIRHLLHAAQMAPSACNYQPWVFIVIRDKYARFSFSRVYNRSWFLNAPVIIVACCDHNVSWRRRDSKDFGEIDCAIAFDHLTLAAAEVGLGTCWVGAFDAAEAHSLLKLPDSIEPVALTPLGYPASECPPEKKRKNLDEMVYWETFGRKG